MPNVLPGPDQKDQRFVMDERMRRMIAGAIAEIDPAQIAILRTFTPAERFRQMMSMIKFIEDVGAYRLHTREPELTESDALRIVRSGEMMKRKLQKRSLGTNTSPDSDLV